jgi:hypothetical protein
MLPAAVRTELHRLIVERAFSSYHAIAEWLQAQGFHISDDSVQRYGVRLRCQLDIVDFALHQARALAAGGKNPADNIAKLTAITVQQIQQQVLSISLQRVEVHEASDRSSTSAVINAADSDDPGHAERTESVSDMPQPTQARPDPPRPAQPQLTAPGRSYPHKNRLSGSHRICHQMVPARTIEMIAEHIERLLLIEPNRYPMWRSPHKPGQTRLNPLNRSSPHLTAPGRSYPH